MIARTIATSAFSDPTEFSVRTPDVGDAQVEKTVHSVDIRRGFEGDLGLVGRRAATGIQNDPGAGQLDVAGVFRLDDFPAKNSDVQVLRFFLVPCGEEMRSEESFVCNRCSNSHTDLQSL